MSHDTPPLGAGEISFRAEEDHETEDDWTQATTGQRINHYASGIHREMIDPPYVQQNVAIIDQILNLTKQNYGN